MSDRRAPATSDKHQMLLAKFLARTKQAGDCQEYLGSIQSNGYSRVCVDGKSEYGHRFVFRATKGAIRKGQDICHSCDNRKCINPNHLFAGSRLKNMRDCKKKGRLSVGEKHSATVRRGESANFAKLTVIQVREIRTSVGTQKEVAMKYSVDPSLIGYIRRGKIWQSVA